MADMKMKETNKRLSSENPIPVPSTYSAHLEGTRIVHEQIRHMELTPNPEYLLPSTSNTLRPETPLENLPYVDPDCPYIGATPDGRVRDNMIVEVKCPVAAFKLGWKDWWSTRCVPLIYGQRSMLLHLLIFSTALAATSSGKHPGGAEAPEFGEPLMNLTAPLGRDATFKCIVVNLGNYRVGWVKADTKAIQAIHEHVITHNPRVSVSHTDHSTWYLHIKSVQEEDRGQYMCQINTDPMKSQMGHLEVVIPPDFIPEETSGDTMVPEGGTARVSCKARGVPAPRVMWKREDGHDIVVRDHTGIKSKVTTFQGEVLKLAKISRSEMGTYLCIAANGVPPTVSKRIHISVHFHPVIQVPNQLVGAPLGTGVKLECFVESSPKSINYWVKDPGELIIPSEHYEMDVIQKSTFEAKMTMTIKSIRKEDLGSYICVAKNSLGDVESKIRLYEIPGNDRHSPQYHPSEDDYESPNYDELPIKDNDKNNRVVDKANKWYANDGKVLVNSGSHTLVSPVFGILLSLIVVSLILM